ncbi:hypothetical protein JCM11251_001582 [Rhodosporidiobolus azoricus]
MSTVASTSTTPAWPIASSSSKAEPPTTPIRTFLPLYLPPDDACPPRTRNPRKRAPPSPLDSTFERRDHLFMLSTASERRPLSPSTPTAPLLPPAPIFMPLLPTTPSPTSSSSMSSALRSSPMKRSPALRTLCKFTADAFREERERFFSTSSSSSSSSSSARSTPSLPSSISPNSLGLFDIYRDTHAAQYDSFLASPEPPASPASFSSTSSGRWSDAPESENEGESSFTLFAGRNSHHQATTNEGGALSFRTIPLPDIASLPITARPPIPHSTSSSSYLDDPFSLDVAEPSSPVPSLTFSSPSNSSPASSLASLSSSPSAPSSPSPVTSCISTFASTSFFSSPTPLSSGSFLAQRRLELLEKRKMRAAIAFSPRRDEEVFGLGFGLRF